jgi:hypothetical protein
MVDGCEGGHAYAKADPDPLRAVVPHVLLNRIIGHRRVAPRLAGLAINGAEGLGGMRGPVSGSRFPLQCQMRQ